MSARLPRLDLYGRPGCHLCEAARAVVERVGRTHPFSLHEHDIERDDALHAAYLERIPVLRVDGVERFELEVDADGLAAALRASGRPLQ